MKCRKCNKELTDKHKKANKADMVFTDPPYNLQEFGGSKRTNKEDKKREPFGAWDEKFKPSLVVPLINLFCKDDAHIFICASHQTLGEINSSLLQFTDKTGYLVWVKNNPMPSLSKRTFVSCTELIVQARKGSPSFKYPSGSNLTNVIQGNVEKHEFGHPAQKPIYFIEYFLSPTEGSVLDLFGGSGSTLIACEKTNRKCFMMELDPHYIDVIVSRWCKYTGQTKIKRNGEEIEWKI